MRPGSNALHVHLTEQHRTGRNYAAGHALGNTLPDLRVRRPLRRRAVGARPEPCHQSWSRRVRPPAHRPVAGRVRGAGGALAHIACRAASTARHQRRRPPRQGVHHRTVHDVTRGDRRRRVDARHQRHLLSRRAVAQHVRPDVARRRACLGRHRRPRRSGTQLARPAAGNLRPGPSPGHRGRTSPGVRGRRPAQDRTLGPSR